MAEARVHPLMRDRAVGLPPETSRLLERATAALDAQDPQSAETALVAVLAVVPECTEALRMQGLVLHLRGDFAGAVAMLERAHALKPGDALIQMNLATARYACGESDAALAGLQRACAMTPDFAPAWYNLGKMYMLQERAAGAITALHRALDLEPEHVPARVVLAQAQASLGAVLQASANYREALRLKQFLPAAWVGLARLDAEPFSADDVVQLQYEMQKPQANVAARISLGFALTRALEDQGKYPAAFRALRKANALMSRKLNWDATRASAQVSAIHQAFAHAPSAPVDPQLGEAVIFVVGLPRSGSTLTAQVLAAHHQVELADELPWLEQVIDAESERRQQPFPSWCALATPQDWHRLGQDYLARIGSRQRSHFVDHCEGNWRLVGAALAMLPGARVVNSRRDALDTCFDCYRELFVRANEFSYELDHMVRYWHDFDRLSRHWQALFSVRFLDIHFEAWQTDAAMQLRRLLDFCRLVDDPACLELVRDPPGARRSSRVMAGGQLSPRDIARRARYGGNLNRLRALLGERQAGN